MRILTPTVWRHSALVALVVGTVLNLINQGDALVEGGDVSWSKVTLTYVVPFFVTLYGAWVATRTRRVEPHVRNDD